MSILLFILWFFVVRAIVKPEPKARPKKYTPEKYPVKYPKGPVSEVYAEILQDIENCTDKKTMNAVYVRILIFQGCYSDATDLLKELVEYYRKKERLINS